LGTHNRAGHDGLIHSRELVFGGDLSLCKLIVRLENIWCSKTGVVRLTMDGADLEGVSVITLICGTLS
jgi:hypothetical protein